MAEVLLGMQYESVKCSILKNYFNDTGMWNIVLVYIKDVLWGNQADTLHLFCVILNMQKSEYLGGGGEHPPICEIRGFCL